MPHSKGVGQADGYISGNGLRRLPAFAKGMATLRLGLDANGNLSNVYVERLSEDPQPFVNYE